MPCNMPGKKAFMPMQPSSSHAPNNSSMPLRVTPLSFAPSSAAMSAFFVDDWRNSKAVPTRIARVDGRPMGVAGLWESWKAPEGERVDYGIAQRQPTSYNAITLNFHEFADMWRDVLPGLMQRYRVIAVDMRGLGDSSRPATGYDTRTVAQDIWRLMTEVLDERCFHVVAHDWGGPVAYALAALHRQAVMSMAIFDAPVPGDGSVLTAMGRWHFGFHSESDLPEALIDVIARAAPALDPAEQQAWDELRAALVGLVERNRFV